MKKVLILTVTAGGGHNSTAKALKDDLDSRGIESEVLDIYLTINKGLYNLVSKGYLFSIKELKKLYAKVYSSLELRRGNSYTRSGVHVTSKMLSKKIYEFICGYDPDVIVYSHVFAGELLDVMQKKHLLRAKTVGIVTDFIMHPFWEECLRTDYVVIPNEMLIPAARRKGFTTEQILPLGIPINPKFSNSRPKDDVRAELGLTIGKPTVLLMGGSMGYGDMAGIIEKLDASDADFQMIAVCGSNAEAKEAISRLRTRKKVLNLGFVSNVDELMDASDCMVSKPGGLSTSEALAKRLPMIIMNPIPGQEDRNSEFLRNCGVAMAVSNGFPLSDAIYQLTSYPERLAQMRASIVLIRKPDETVNLGDFVVDLLQKEVEPSGVTV